MEQYLNEFSEEIVDGDIIMNTEYEIISGESIYNFNANTDDYSSETVLDAEQIDDVKVLLKKWKLNHLLPILEGNVHYFYNFQNILSIY